MKKFKNNKGLTGIDVVVSITIIVIVLSIVTTVYVTYSRKAKEVKRATIATNLAMTVIEYIEGLDINNSVITNIPITETVIASDYLDDYGINNMPNGYTVAIKRTALTSAAAGAELINALAFQVDVTVTYRVENNNKSITLSAIKKKNGIEEAEKPNIKGNEIYNNTTLLESDVIPVKYDNGADGYVKTNQYDSEWYSISSKVFPIVIKLKNGAEFNRNGIVKLNDTTKIDKIYVWMPSYYHDGTNYRFCNKDGKRINYESDTVTLADSTTAVIYDYKLNNTAAASYIHGQWIEVDSNLNPLIPNTNYDNLKNQIFTW